MDEKTKKQISSVSDELRALLERKSARALPDRPSEAGMKPDEIKRAFWAPLFDAEGSLLAETERVIKEANELLGPLHETECDHGKRIGTLETFKKDTESHLFELDGTLTNHAESLAQLALRYGSYNELVQRAVVYVSASDDELTVVRGIGEYTRDYRYPLGIHEAVKKEYAALVNGAPEQLDTLQELAKALADNANFATETVALIAERAKTADLTSGAIVVNKAEFAECDRDGDDIINTYAKKSYVDGKVQKLYRHDIRIECTSEHIGGGAFSIVEFCVYSAKPTALPWGEFPRLIVGTSFTMVEGGPLPDEFRFIRLYLTDTGLVLRLENFDCVGPTYDTALGDVISIREYHITELSTEESPIELTYAEGVAF